MSTFGPAFDERRDGARLHHQQETIRELMADARWRTLAEIAEQAGFPEASVSAQLRHLRKPQFGGFVVEKRRRGGSGLWEYRVCPPKPAVPLPLSTQPPPNSVTPS